MPFSERSLLETVDSIYESALDPRRFPHMLERLDRLLGATAADFYMEKGGRLLFSAGTGISDELISDYLSSYHHQNPRMGYARRATTGRMFTDLDYLSERRMARHPFFQEFLRKARLGHNVGLVLLREKRAAAMIGLHLPVKAGPPTTQFYSNFKRIAPHLVRASQIRLRLNELELECSSLTTAVDFVPFGVLFVDERARLLGLNRAAEQILEAGDGLSVRNGQLVAHAASQTRRLHHSVSRATASAHGNGCGIGDVFSISRPSVRRSLSLLVAPLPGQHQILTYRAPRVAIFVTDPERESQSPTDLLMCLYRLSPAEARLAGVLMQGISLREAADQLEVTYETARSQLKSVFLKTETSRQGELVRLLLRSTAALEFGPGTPTESPKGGLSALGREGDEKE